MDKKRMKIIPSLFKNKETTSTSSWKWPLCIQPKTHSFRVDKNDIIFNSLNSVYFGGIEEDESCFTNSSDQLTESAGSTTISTVSEDQQSGEESLEMVISGLRSSERLFFEPSTNTNSILQEYSKINGGFRYKESMVLEIETKNPYLDFKKSMEEMVEVHGFKDWKCLEELLSWYLKVNGKKNHGYIIGAFVDLLVSLVVSSSFDDDDHHDDCHANSSSSSSSLSSKTSFFSLSSIFQDHLGEDIVNESCLKNVILKKK